MILHLHTPLSKTCYILLLTQLWLGHPTFYLNYVNSTLFTELLILCLYTCTLGVKID